MLVPIIFTLDTILSNMSQVWMFYKAITYAKRNNWPVIAQEDYFLKYEQQKKLFPYFFEENTAKTFHYDIPSEEDIKKIYQIRIPNKIIETYIANAGSQTDAYIESFKSDWPEMESFLVHEIDLYEKCGFKIDGFICLSHLKFVSNVARKLDKKVFYMEWSPFRYSVYRNAAYFDLNDSYLEYYNRYQAFYANSYDVPILSSKDILALFLNREYYNLLDKSFEENIYEIGIAGTYNNVVETRAYTNYDILEELNHANKIFCDSGIVVRYHPGDPIKAKVQCNSMEGGTLFEFICKCKRIMSINSNVEFEAMLLGKPVYDESIFSRYKGFTNNSLNSLEDITISDEAINFITFVVFAPFELIDCDEYIRFRLSEPSDYELYKYHLDYYIHSIGLTNELFNKPKSEWFGEIVKAKNANKSNKMEFSNKNDLVSLNAEVNRLKNVISLLEEENEKNTIIIDELHKINCTQEEQINGLKNSISMRLTKPMRILGDLLAKNRF